jgi:hypothetical protein
MVGVVKSGKVLCVECGAMTEYTNHNRTQYGPVCTQHIATTMQSHHPAYRSNASTVALLEQTRRKQLAKFRKHPPHPRALITDGERRLCQVCSLMPPDVRVTALHSDYTLHPVECCSICHYNMRPLLLRHAMVPLPVLQQFATARHYKHSL